MIQQILNIIKTPPVPGNNGLTEYADGQACFPYAGLSVKYDVFSSIDELKFHRF
ncbi:conserved hypothetical protein [delta proteobacterium NaphS2]|nr:conserved hypothetical protein [delta proteobacterium NaphS2]